MTKLKNSNCDKTKKNQIMTKLKLSNCDKLLNSNCDKTEKFKFGQISKNQIFTKLKKLKMGPNLKLKY